MGIDKEQFLNPDRRYAIYPIYHSGIIQGAQNADELLDWGYAGLVGNIPYTEDFPHNNEAWNMTEQAYRKLIKKGMHTWIYDENGYPSGS